MQESDEKGELIASTSYLMIGIDHCRQRATSRVSRSIGFVRIDTAIDIGNPGRRALVSAIDIR